MRLSKEDELLVGLALATGSEFFTADALNLVLPDMAGTLSLSQDEASWIITTYNAALFLGVPLSIWLGDRVGHRRLIVWSTIAFAAMAAAACCCSTLQTMLVLRAMQGIAGSTLFMWWRGTIYMLVPGPKRSQSLMKVSTCLYGASALGLIFAGFVTDHLTWRLLFIPNLVFGVGACLILVRDYPDVPEREGERAPPADAFGIALLGAAIVSLQIFLSRGQIEDWFGTTHMQVLAWGACACFSLFILWQMAPDNTRPLVSLDLLADRNIVAAATIGVGAGIILSASVYALPQFLRTVDPQPHSAGFTGLVMSAYPLSAMMLRPFATPFIARFGQRKGIAVGLGALIIAMLLLARLMTIETPDAYYLPSLALYAVCLCLILPSIGGGTVSKIPNARQLDGVTIYMSCRQFGSSLGVALISLMLAHRETLHSTRLFEHLRTDTAGVETWLEGARAVVVARGGEAMSGTREIALKMLQMTAQQQVATLAYADCFVFMALVGLATLCLVPIMTPFQKKT